MMRKKVNIYLYCAAVALVLMSAARREGFRRDCHQFVSWHLNHPSSNMSI